MPALKSRFFQPLMALACAGSLSAATAFGPGPVPAFVAPIEFDTAAQAPEGEAADGIYILLSDNQIDVGSQSHYTHVARKVISEAGLADVSRISIGFNPAYEEIRVHRITLLRQARARQLLAQAKPVVLRREEDLENGMLDGRKTLVYDLEDIRVGDVLEYAYTMRGRNPIFLGKATGSTFLRYTIPLGRRYFRLTHPADREVQFKGLNGASTGKLRSSGTGWERVWDERGVKPLIQEYDVPFWHDAYPRVQWSEYGDWGGVAEWAAAMYDFEAPLSPALQEWVRRHGSQAPREKVRSALRLVQDSVRYLGLELGESSHRPALPSVTYARRFGDCKDKVFLFCTLLKRMGLRAGPALVNTSAGDRITAWQPSPVAFDHVIAKVVLEEKYYWFDATILGQRGDPFELQALPYRKALALDQRGFEDIMVGPSARGSVSVKMDFDVPRWDSAVTLAVKSSYTRVEAESMRATLIGGNRAELRKTYTDYYATRFPGIRAVGGLEIEDDTLSNVLTIKERYALDSLCGRDEATGRLECSIFPQEVGAFLNVPERRERDVPYGLAYPKHYRQEIDLHLREALDLDKDEGRESTRDFEFSWKEYSTDSLARFVYEYQAQSDHVPPERFAAYVKALDRIEANLGATLFPEGGQGGGLNYLFILLAAAGLGAGIWAARRLSAIPAWGYRATDPALEKQVGGALWLVALGVILAPFFHLKEIWDLKYLAFQVSWKSLTVQGSEQYHPLWEPALISSTVLTLVGFCLSCALLPMFFRRRANFPAAYAVSTGVAIFGLILDQAAGFLIPTIRAEMTGSASPGAAARGIVVSIVWIFYLFRGSRPRETFVVRDRSAGAPPGDRETDPPARERDAQTA